MAQSAFSFHCMICFEEFRTDVRYPVVLPCGHTYVCNSCADRLDKCMECRTSLTYTVQSPQTPTMQVESPSYRRYHRSGPPRMYQAANGAASPKVPPVKKRLPLPKNVVLCSLIEATELASEGARKGLSSSPRESIGEDDDGLLAVSEDDEGEEERIRLGTSVAVSVAGTYAVASSEALPIFATLPPAMTDESIQPTVDADVDALVRSHQNRTDSTTDTESVQQAGMQPLHQSSQDQPFAKLNCGDRVQVVSLEKGWAKLARGYGFVRADGQKLVKVGNSVDRACKLEAMLRCLSQERKRLRVEQSKLDNIFIRLMNDLQISLITDDDLTVISAEIFPENAGGKRENGKRDAPTAEDERRDSEPSEERSTPQNLDEKGKPSTDGTVANMSMRGGLGSFAQGVMNSISGSFDEDRQARSNQEAQTAPSTAASAGTVARSSLASQPHPSPSAMSAGARAWRARHGRDASKGIDFRTGLSGHTALMSSNSNAHAQMESYRGTDFRKMSFHTGLSMPKAAQGIFRDMYEQTHILRNLMASPPQTPPHDAASHQTPPRTPPDAVPSAQATP